MHGNVHGFRFKTDLDESYTSTSDERSTVTILNYHFELLPFVGEAVEELSELLPSDVSKR
jgi:hypothetical protein